MSTIQNWLDKNTAELIKVNVESARLDCLVLLEDTLKKPREWLLAHNETPISVSEERAINRMLKQRLNHIPLAYITGHKEFYGRDYLVDSDVLIPRPESEDIIDLLLGLDESSFEKVIDVGAGSGCLAITAKLELPNSNVVAIDNSIKALEVAKRNANRLKAEVDFIVSDLIESVTLSDKTVILANLPYVPSGLITSTEITREPKEALFSGEDGLSHYQLFWSQLAVKNKDGLTIIVESLEDQHPAISKMAFNAGYQLIESRGLAQLFK